MFCSKCRQQQHILTLVEDLEATIWPTVVSGEKQIQEVTATKQELRDLGSIKWANQRGEQVGTIMHFQKVITKLSLKP